MTNYIATFYRPSFDHENVVIPSTFLWFNPSERNKLIHEWANIMVEDTVRPEGTPLYEYTIFINGKVAMSSDDIENDHDYETGPDPLELTQEEHDDIKQILALAGSEHDTILKRLKDEEWIHNYPPETVPGPGRRQ